MPRLSGRQAIVVGAGIGGLTAARVLADHFERVIILERDAPTAGIARPGVPQGRHTHFLMAGGLHALASLFPGFEQDLVAAGATPLTIGLDIRVEQPGYDPFPQRDLGFSTYSLSRPQLERCVRERLSAFGNVEFRTQCRALALVASADGSAVTGLTCRGANDDTETLTAEFVVDASAAGSLALELLRTLGCNLPEITSIGWELAYSTAVFSIPDESSKDWKSVATLGKGLLNRRSALLLPIEGCRWQVSIIESAGMPPSTDTTGFMEYLQKLRTRTIFEAVRNAQCAGPIARQRIPQNSYTHYERLEWFPNGIVVLGDAICRLNPLYGHGMSVAAQEAVRLGQILSQRAAMADPLNGLARVFFDQTAQLLETPWEMATRADLVGPAAGGERTPDIEQRLRAIAALTRLASLDATVHKLNAEVTHLLKPRSALQCPALVERLKREAQAR